MNGVKYIKDSKNKKISGRKLADTTYVSIQSSCPNSCELKDGNGCYAELSFVGIHVRRLDKEAESLTPLQVARAEAKVINESYDGEAVPSFKDLRLHVSGDSRTIQGSRLINKAAGHWLSRQEHPGKVWGYTHAWSNVPRKEWSNVEILASVSSIDEVKLARDQGYAPAIIVGEHLSNRVYSIPNSDIKWIPCPAQLKEEVSCTSCRLCFDTKRLFDNKYGIAFAAHGVKKNQIKKHLKVIQ